MATRREGEFSASTVQLAFDPNPTPHHCGYCNANGSCSAGSCFSQQSSSIRLRKIRSSNCGYCQRKNEKFSFGIVASTMLVDDYQILMDRGWRKCGTYYYKALMKKTCCPLYTIRCDANNFQISPSQRRVVQTMNRFINENIRPADRQKAAAGNLTTTSAVPKSTRRRKEQSTMISTNLEDWIKNEPSTNAIELLRHVLNSDAPPPDNLMKRLKSRQKRWYRKLLKLKRRNQLSLATDLRQLIKRVDRMNISSSHLTLEQMLKFSETTKNRLETRLIRSYPPSEEFQKTLKTSHAVYQRYQMAIHGDSSTACKFSQFQNFLCQSSLEEKSSRIPSNKYPSCGYGSFHLQYYLNEKLIACSVIDILPSGVSSVYFYYEPDFSFLKLGVYSALKEMALTRELAREVVDIKYYYLGFYVHSCVKMRYKGQYKPSFLLCPETYTWHPIEKCRPLLNANKYVRFELDLNKVDEDEENNLENLKLRVHRQIISPRQLQQRSESYFDRILECFVIFAKFAGRVCANRMIIDLN